MSERLPWPPVEALLVVEGCDSDAAVAELLELSTSSVRNWRVRGTLPVWTADKIATALGFHPAMIWPTSWLWPDWRVIADAHRADSLADLRI